MVYRFLLLIYLNIPSVTPCHVQLVFCVFVFAQKTTKTPAGIILATRSSYYVNIGMPIIYIYRENS